MIESNRQKLSSPTGGTTNIRCSNVHQQPSSTNFKNSATTQTSSRQLLHPLSYKSNHFSQSFDSSGIGADMPKDNNNYRNLSMKNDFIHHNQQKSMNEIDRKHGQYITAARPATSQATYYKRQEHHDDKNNRRTSDSYSHQQQQQHHKSFDFYGRQWKSDDATSPSQMHTIDEDHQLDAMSLKPEHHHSSTPLSTNLLSITPQVSIDICCSPTDTTNSEQSLGLTLQLFTVRQKRALRSTFVQLNAGGNLIRLMSLILHRVSLKCPEMRALFLTTGFVNTLNRRHCAQSQSSSTIITEHDHCIMMARLLDDIVERIDAFDEIIPRLRKFGEKHARMSESGFRVEMIEKFGEMAVTIIGAHESIKCNQEALKAWRLLIASITDEMRYGYERENRRLMMEMNRKMSPLLIIEKLTIDNKND